MAVGNGSPDNAPQTTQPESAPQQSGRWDFLKVPAKYVRKLWDYPTDETRRKMIKGGAIVGGVVGAVATLGAVAERSLQKGGEDKLYRIGDENVQLSFKEFTPKEGEIKDPEEAVIFLVGAPMRAKASVTQGQLKGLADEFKAKAYSVDARPKGRFHSNSIDLEVEAIRRFVEELNQKGIKKVTLFGHSIGAAKAVKLAVALEQMDPQIQINGVVLANPMGFYPQDGKDLLLNRYIPEVSNEGRLKNPRAPHEPLYKVGWQLVGSLASEVAAVGSQYPKLVDDQLGVLTQVNPELAKMKSHALVLLASEDKWSEAEKIVPETEIEKRLSAPKSIEQIRGEIASSGRWDRLSDEEKAKFGNKDNFVTLFLNEDYLKKYRTRENIARAGRARRAYLKEAMPESDRVGVIKATKYATHLAYSIGRPRQTSHLIVEVRRFIDKLKQDDLKNKKLLRS